MLKVVALTAFIWLACLPSEAGTEEVRMIEDLNKQVSKEWASYKFRLAEPHLRMLVRLLEKEGPKYTRQLTLARARLKWINAEELTAEDLGYSEPRYFREVGGDGHAGITLVLRPDGSGVCYTNTTSTGGTFANVPLRWIPVDPDGKALCIFYDIHNIPRKEILSLLRYSANKVCINSQLTGGFLVECGSPLR